MIKRLSDLMQRGPRTALLGFAKDRGGVAAVEFALLLPLMIIMYFGTLELTQAVSVNQKVNHVASSVADLVTQSQSITGSEMTDIFSAASAILTPFDATGLKIVVAAVDFDDDGNGKVGWSAAHNTTAYSTGQPPPVTIPSALEVPNSQVIVGVVEYSHNSMFGTILYDIIGKTSFDFDEMFILKPRLSDTVAYSG